MRAFGPSTVSDGITRRVTETVIDGAAHPDPFTISNEEGGSPLKNVVFGVFPGGFALAGTGADGYLIYLLAARTLGL